MILVLSLLIGCAGHAERQARKAEGAYSLGALPGWEEVRPGGADFAWRKAEIGATIYADSNCGKHYEDAKLEKLAEKALVGVAEGKPSVERELELDGRAAFQVRQQGRIDGVPVELGATVLKKHFCVYDIVLVSPRGASFEQAWQDYSSAVDGFRTE